MDATTGQRAVEAAQTHRVLLFENGPHEQFALPLLQIRRVEMIGPDRIERVGDYEYVTIDGVSMRLLRLDKVMNVSAPAAAPADSALPGGADPAQVCRRSRWRSSRRESWIRNRCRSNCRPIRNTIKASSARPSSADRMTLFLDIHQLTQRLFGVAGGRPCAGLAAGPDAQEAASH